MVERTTRHLAHYWVSLSEALPVYSTLDLSSVYSGANSRQDKELTEIPNYIVYIYRKEAATLIEKCRYRQQGPQQSCTNAPSKGGPKKFEFPCGIHC